MPRPAGGGVHGRGHALAAGRTALCVIGKGPAAANVVGGCSRPAAPARRWWCWPRVPGLGRAARAPSRSWTSWP
uniref:hypothetical protein n=1 Tax=Sphingopyxis terrae TaxID=33052 RepID=UPI0036D43A30